MQGMLYRREKEEVSWGLCLNMLSRFCCCCSLCWIIFSQRTHSLQFLFSFAMLFLFLIYFLCVWIVQKLQLTVIDMICYIIWINVAPDTNPVRWSRPLRPLFIINFSDGKQVSLLHPTGFLETLHLSFKCTMRTRVTSVCVHVYVFGYVL